MTAGVAVGLPPAGDAAMDVITSGHWWYANTPAYIEADGVPLPEPDPPLTETHDGALLTLH